MSASGKFNAIRGHLTEYGWIASKGPSHVAMLADLLEEEEMASSLPEAARAMFRLMLDLLAGLGGKIAVGQDRLSSAYFAADLSHRVRS